MLRKVVREESIMKNENEETPKIYKEQKKNERQDRWCGKKLHGQFLKGTKEIRGTDSWKWLKRGELKKGTELIIIAAQDQDLQTNWYGDMMKCVK